ncbi:hypothetical protein OG417_07820 [Actinoallomurus sp. NBC_01490]|uniref:hypothetical protein n=1 Tax=Actinoallomurus sp. NBC_01490 TaxID=2903557 RepID=UPI002E2F15BF|nr:hypothetical protein [Actinoallomurus sp. NBC_01490]
MGLGVVPPLWDQFDPDEIVDFHAARLLILLNECGAGAVSKRIDGRTKLVKLDFFLRYGHFLERAHQELVQRGQIDSPYVADVDKPEAPMIRYLFGPWDPRYRRFIAFLEARGLVRVGGTKIERVSLTRVGKVHAERLANEASFATIVARARAMRGNMADWTGTQLKEFIYEVLQEEVADLELGEEI